MRSFVNEAVGDPNVDGIILTTVCDQMRRAAEVVTRNCKKSVFLMHVPTTWQTKASYQYYLEELLRLGRFLVRQGGTEPKKTELILIMEAHERGRVAVLSNQSLVKGKELTDALQLFIETGKVFEGAVQSIGRIPVGVIGGPLSRRDCALFDEMEIRGGFVVLDGTENGERTMPARFNRRQMAEDPLDELANAYFGHIPDVFKRPNSPLFVWLKEMIEKREIKGFVILRYVFCDCWHAEVHRLKEWLSIPVIDIDLAGDGGIGRNQTRIQAFMESLK